mmetsp:Transcript_39982/g.58875  ORF Transcript_39982/g.58875 Transcript_39982/m.58875 type:complete len:87 (+) Transcript_39982:126-386(+)
MVSAYTNYPSCSSCWDRTTSRSLKNYYVPQYTPHQAQKYIILVASSHSKNNAAWCLVEVVCMYVVRLMEARERWGRQGRPYGAKLA